MEELHNTNQTVESRTFQEPLDDDLSSSAQQAIDCGRINGPENGDWCWDWACLRWRPNHRWMTSCALLRLQTLGKHVMGHGLRRVCITGHVTEVYKSVPDWQPRL